MKFLKQILLDWEIPNINEDVYDNFFDLNHNNGFFISYYPKRIESVEKFVSTEIFWQRYLDKEISFEDVNKVENNIINFINTLWNYNTVDLEYFREDYFNEKDFKKLFAKFSKETKNKARNICSHDIIKNIDKDLFDIFVKSSVRDMQISTYFVFNEWKMIICFSDYEVHGIARDKSKYSLLKDIATANSLYFVEANEWYKN